MCNNQQTFNDILEADVVSTPEVIIYDSLRLPMTQTTLKKPSAGK